MHEHEVGSERQCLLVCLLGEPAAADPLGEAQVVADQRARSRLPTDAAFVDNENSQPFGGAVHRRRQARRAGAHDGDVERALLELRGCTCSLRDLGVRRVGQDAAVGKHHQRKLRVHSRLRDQLAPLIRVRERESMRDCALLEDLPQLEGSTRPRLTDDVNGLGNGASFPRPFEQETRHGLMKHLVARPSPAVARSSRYARVPSNSESHLRSTRPSRHPETPASPASRAGEAPRLLQQPTFTRMGQRLSNEHQGHLFAPLLRALSRTRDAESASARQTTRYS